MNSLLDGTSRLSQIALCVLVGAIVMTVCSATVTGSAKIGPALMVVAGGIALFTYVRDRADYGMWPAYVTVGVAVLGLLFSIPLILNTSGLKQIAADGLLVHQELIPQQAALNTAFTECTHDGPNGNCTSASIARVEVAATANVRVGRDCTTSGEICISDEPGGGYSVEYVTRPLTTIGVIRFDELRTVQNRVISTSCHSISAQASMTEVRAACGPGVVVAAANG